MKKIKVFFAGTQASSMIWYRMYSFVPYLNKMGFECVHSRFNPDLFTIAEWEEKMMDNPQIVKDLQMLTDNADISVFQKFQSEQGMALIAALKERNKKIRIVMESDDWLFGVPAWNNARNGFKDGSIYNRHGKEQINESMALITSQQYLADKFGEFYKHVFVVPNGLEFRGIWDKIGKKPAHKDIRIGWTGGMSHEGDLRLLVNPVKEILAKYPNVNFYFIGGAPSCIPPSERVFHTRDFHGTFTYPKWFNSFGLDIQLAPLRDCEFNRCKSNVKFLESSAMHSPLVASDIWPYRQDIKNGVNGFLCKNEDDWIVNLSFLIEHEKERKAMAEKAYRQVKKEYDVKDLSKTYADVLHRILDMEVSL